MLRKRLFRTVSGLRDYMESKPIYKGNSPNSPAAGGKRTGDKFEQSRRILVIRNVSSDAITSLVTFTLEKLVARCVPFGKKRWGGGVPGRNEI
jgi:hypothetical protein